jgi:hypothetical protein
MQQYMDVAQVGHQYLGFICQYLAAVMRDLNVSNTLSIWQSGVKFLGLMPRLSSSAAAGLGTLGTHNTFRIQWAADSENWISDWH